MALQYFYLCPDIDECVVDSIDCGVNGVCINIKGSYRCDCNDGFYRNGSYCCEFSGMRLVVFE